VLRALQVGVVAWLLVRWDSPRLGSLVYLKDSLVVLLAVFFLGKLVYDTLFYDRFRP